MLLVELFENQQSLGDSNPGLGMTTVYRVAQQGDVAVKPDMMVVLSKDTALSYARHISKNKNVTLWILRALVDPKDVYKTDHPDRYEYKGSQILGKKVTEVDPNVKETKFYGVKGGLRIPASNEETNLIETIIEKDCVKNSELNERDQELARILTSRGLLERVFIDKELCFKFNKLTNIHRY